MPAPVVIALPGSPAFSQSLVHVHQRLAAMAAARARPGRREARAPPEQKANTQGNQDDSDERSSQLDLLDALDEDGHEGTQRRDTDGDVEARRDDMEGKAKRGRGRGSEPRERDPRRRGATPGR